MSHKTTDLPGSNDKQPNSKRRRNYEARDTSGEQPNMEQVRDNHNKAKQGPEDEHLGQTKSELARERGGHGHSGHSSNRSGSDSGN